MVEGEEEERLQLWTSLKRCSRKREESRTLAMERKKSAEEGMRGKQKGLLMVDEPTSTSKEGKKKKAVVVAQRRKKKLIFISVRLFALLLDSRALRLRTRLLCPLLGLPRIAEQRTRRRIWKIEVEKRTRHSNGSSIGDDVNIDILAACRAACKRHHDLERRRDEAGPRGALEQRGPSGDEALGESLIGSKLEGEEFLPLSNFFFLLNLSTSSELQPPPSPAPSPRLSPWP